MATYVYANELCNPGFEYVYDPAAGCQTSPSPGGSAEEWTLANAIRSGNSANGNNCRTGDWCLYLTPSPVGDTVNAISGSKTITTGITWSSYSHTSNLPDYNDLKKIAGINDWNTDAISAERIYASDVLKGMKFRCSQTDGYVMAGLSHDDPDTNYTGIDYAIYCRPDGYVHVYENGVVKYGGTGYPYTVGDVLSIILNAAGYPEYRKNNRLIYTSTTLPDYPLFVDSSIRTLNAVIDDVHQSSSYIHAYGYVKGTSGTASIIVSDASGNDMGSCKSEPLTVTSSYQLISVNCIPAADVFTISLVGGGQYWDDVSAELVYGRATPYNLLPPATLTISPDPGYTQTFTYFTKSTTITASATLTTNTNITGVRFTIDGGNHVDDTNTSDLNYSGVLSGLSSGLHTIEARTMEGGLPTEIAISNQFYIVDQIWGFYGDSTTTGSYASSSISRPLQNILTLANSQAIVTGGAEGTGGRQSSNGLSFEQRDPFNGAYLPGSMPSFVNAMADGGKNVFVINEGKGADDTSTLLRRWPTNKISERCTSLDEISGNAAMYGLTHANIHFGINDVGHRIPQATFESNLNKIVQNLIDCGIPPENIYLSYPDYASHRPHDAINYLDEIDRVITNKSISVGPDYYHFIKEHQELLDPGGYHLEWQGYSQRGRLLARYVLGYKNRK